MTPAKLLSRGLSLVIHAAYLVAAYISGGGALMVKVAAGLLLPLACIWFPEPLGNYTGLINLQSVSEKTPAFFVSAIGWFLLVVIPLIVYALVGRT